MNAPNVCFFTKYVIINFMKILFITDLYPMNQGENKTPLTLHYFVSEWISQGHKVDVIKPNFLLNSFFRKKKVYKTGFYEYEKVKIFNVNYFTPFFFDVLNKIPKVFNFKEYDLIIAHMPSGIIFANKLNALVKKPLICGVHVSDIEVLTKPLYKFYFRKQLKYAYKNAKKIACRSDVLKRKFDKLFPEFADKTFVASSGVSVDKDKAVTAKKVFEKNTLKVLTCANLIKRKNIDKLVMAMNGLDDFELTVIGDGKQFEKLKKLSSSLNLESNVTFLGRLPNEKVLDVMRHSDIFILPSVNETFGMVYLEAMSSGCVTVCTKNDGIDGIIKDSENGFLCDPTVEGIRETLLRIKSFENIPEIIENSVKTVKDYTKEKCAINYLQN